MLILRPYQDDAIAQTRALIRAGKLSILINAPTGAGKTVLGARILQGAFEKGSPTLFLAHRRELIEQSAAKIQEAGISEYGIIMAGAKRNNHAALVQVASVQTLIRRELPPAKIIMIDEAHRAAAKTYRDIVANYPGAIIIGLSATPERQDGKGLDDLFESMVTVSTIPELIEQGFLMAPSCYVGRATADLSHVPTRGGDYAEGALEKAMDKPALIGDILTEWKRHANGAPTAIFASGVEHSKHIAQAFWQAGIPAASVDGTTPIKEREAIIADWRRGAIKVVSNCMVFTEGFDFPELEVCVLARPTKSIGLYLQIVGRVMRTAAGKDRALVLDHAGCVELHGAPSIHREWSLQGEKERKKKSVIPELSQCHECQLIFTIEASFFMDADPSKRLLICPGCSTADCPHCAALFKPVLERQNIEGLYEVRTIVCPECGSLYSDDHAHAITSPTSNALPLSADGSMVQYDPSTIPLGVQVKNDYKRLMRIAQEKGWKRGKVWHSLAEKYDRDVLNAALPRHTGAWWKGMA
jgi:superfamily II DNA or RNA helicase